MSQRPYVIFIAGPCGSGKSTIGSELARRLGYEFFDGDDFHAAENKAKMGRGEPLNDDDRSSWLNSLAALWQNRPGKRLVIACSALKRKYREVLLGENPGENRIVVMLKVPRETLQRRMDNRKSHFAKSNLIESQLAALEVPERPDDEPNLILVDGSLPVEEF